MTYLQVRDREFLFEDRPLRLRGVGLGNWLNLEHFMLGIPGTESEIRTSFEMAYGRDAAERFWDRYYHVYTAESDLRFLTELGLNSVRVPVNFKLLEAADGELASARGVRELDRVVARAERLGLFVVIDLHSVPGGQNPDWHCDNASGTAGFWVDQRSQTRVVELWKKLARHFRDCTAVAGYDLINEPCYFDEALNSTMVDFYSACIAGIRSVDPCHVIFIEGNTYARDFSMFERNLDDQIAYSFHYYPFLQLARDLEQPEAASKLRERLFSETSLTHLLEDLNRPVWCGETGHPWHLPGSAPLLIAFLELLEGLGVSWAVWPLKDARAMGLLAPDEHGPWMRLVREATDSWRFWDLFSEDSVACAEAGGDRHGFYRHLAELTSAANARFGERLPAIPFDAIHSALDSFAFEACETQNSVVEPIRRMRRFGSS